MTTYRRRDFLKSTAGVISAGAFAGLLSGCQEEQECSKSEWKGFKYAMCNESMKDLPFAKQCDIINKAGYTGVEIAPFTLVKQGVEEICAGRRKEMVKTMKNAGLECIGLHWLLSPPPKGIHFTTPDKAVREKTVAYMDSLIDFCGDLDGTVMVFGSPNQRGAKGFSISEAEKHFAEGLAKVADHAKQRKVKILIEPLDKSQTNVTNTLSDAMRLVKKVNHPNISTMFDFHNTVDEKLAFDELIKKYYSNIGHVHVQEMDGQYLGRGTAVMDYVKAFQTLKNLNYNKWVSLEVFDFKPGGERIANESMKVLKQIEGKLV
jgi:sugar phosphate isomerase/epimerase